ncbi:hypothetical protein [Sphingomonas pokkalii]|uniref:hypothetical protein n=1 Tax=Sphingomonas pokkalii TaxID=2175090 RepID=UPI003F648761
MLTQITAGPPLRYWYRTTNLLDRLTATGAGQKVSFDAFCKNALSSARSATSFFSRLFSRSGSFIRRD